MTRTALITGCSTGIGRQLAETMHNKGYRVIATARNTDKLESLSKQGITTMALDVTQRDSIQTVRQGLESMGLSVDVLVNNAGYGAMGPIMEMPEEEMEKQFITNIYGPVNMVRTFAPLMRKQGGGMIVNVGSVSGILVTPFSGAYCATKAALHALSDAMRMELAPFNIQVLTVMPGAIKSEFGNSAEASLGRTLPANSVYRWVEEGIQKRARASQANPTPTEEFVDQLLTEIEANHPKAEVTIGNGSKSLPMFARIVPTRIRDYLLKRSFGLHRKPS